MVLVVGGAVLVGLGAVVVLVVVVEVDVDVVGATAVVVVTDGGGRLHALPASAVRPQAYRRAARHTPSTRTALATNG